MTFLLWTAFILTFFVVPLWCGYGRSQERARASEVVGWEVFE